jgi:hypothetical protein
MRHTIEFVSDPDGVIVHTFGRGDVEGFRAMNEELLGDPRFEPGMRILIDHSNLDVSSLTTDEIEEIGRYILSVAERIGTSPVALIASGAVTRLAAEASIGHAVEAAFRPRLFDALADGIRWLQQEC